jgi:phytoene desaturase
MANVVVIGAGAGGLAVACRLAARRHRVTLLEAGDRTGGKLRTLRRDGFAFDTGPSLFTLPAVYRDLFLKTGAPLEDEVDLQPVEPGFRYRFADGTSVTLPGVGVAAAAEALGDQLGGPAAAEWRAVMSRAARMWSLTRGPILGSELQGWRSLAALARRPSDIRTIGPWETLHGLGGRSFTDPRLRQIFDRYATYTGSDPRRAPAVLATVPYVEQTFGAWHLGGGLGTLGEAMARRAERLGVDIRLQHSVTGVEVEGGAVSGVRTADGNRFPADVVVCDADARTLYGHLLPSGTAASAARSAAAAPASLSGFVMLLALRGRSADPVHHEVLFPQDYAAEFDDVFGSRRHPAQPPRDPAIYICSPQDPAMRPDDEHEAWFVLINAPRHGPDGPSTVDWDAPGRKESYADAALAMMSERGLDVRDRIQWRIVTTPADLERGTGSPGGAIYGSASHGPRAAFLRPANRSPVGGLFLVGGSAHPGGGLPLVALSAEIVADAVGRG